MDSAIWLSEAFRKNGQIDQADQVIASLDRNASLDDQAKILSKECDADFAVGDFNLAIKKLQRAAEQGSSQAAASLARDYARGVGVVENKDMAQYWLRRGDGSHSWISRISDFVGASKGWGIVATLAIVALVLPWCTLEIGGRILDAGSLKPGLHWTDLARLAKPLKTHFYFGTLGLSLIYAFSALWYPAALLPLPTVLLFVAIQGISFFSGCCAWSKWYSRIVQSQPSVVAAIRGHSSYLLIFHSNEILLILLYVTAPTEISLYTLVWMGGGLAIYLVKDFVWLKVLRACRVIFFAPKDLQDLVASVVHGREREMPTVYVVPYGSPGAVTRPRAIFLSTEIPKVFAPEEVKVYVAYLLDVLDVPTKEERRVLSRWPLIPIFWLPVLKVSSYYYLWVPQLLILMLLWLGVWSIGNRIARRIANQRSKEPDIAALLKFAEKVFEEELIPMVDFQRKAKPGPAGLYDRMVAAGATPDYPRPAPPDSSGIAVTVIGLVANAIIVIGLWHLFV